MIRLLPACAALLLAAEPCGGGGSDGGFGSEPSSSDPPTSSDTDTDTDADTDTDSGSSECEGDDDDFEEVSIECEDDGDGNTIWTYTVVMYKDARTNYVTVTLDYGSPDWESYYLVSSDEGWNWSYETEWYESSRTCDTPAHLLWEAGGPYGFPEYECDYP